MIGYFVLKCRGVSLPSQHGPHGVTALEIRRCLGRLKSAAILPLDGRKGFFELVLSRLRLDLLILAFNTTQVANRGGVP